MSDPRDDLAALPVLMPAREKLIATIALSIMDDVGRTLPIAQLNTIADAIIAAGWVLSDPHSSDDQCPCGCRVGEWCDATGPTRSAR